ncbi:helix-turn-helix transcriptional regulator [Bdellovibrio sp. 22V]|uniref:helix-turn-helix domain-containing protein n=1 Tax=Bdellovibrio TaxID=958 RepID=UPI0025430FD2|nr:helix-turn-helix transcriptional regulator [Bdellovibrio sp. 22V]WII73382.1 helix-turn-helix transcriptional regulator [Bdellovibrio sp. 22V]
MSEFVKSKSRLDLTPGISVRIAREMLNWSQSQLAEESDIPQSTISGIESGRVPLGAERAERLAIALGVHPAVLLFPNWPLTKKIQPRQIEELKQLRNKTTKKAV